MSAVEERPAAFTPSLLRWSSGAFDLSRGLLGAAAVVIPLVVGFLLGLVEASVLVTIGALNLLLVEAPLPARTSAHVLAIACATNALAFGAGTVVGLAPRVLEIPFVALGIFVALWGTRRPRWENVSFFAAVMFVFAVGVPATTPWGILLRPSAVLLGGVWALGALATVSLLWPRTPRNLFAAPSPGPSIEGGPGPGGLGHAAVVAITATFGFWVALELGLPRDYWVMLTVLVALRPDLAATFAYTAARVLGTIVGASAAFLVTTLIVVPWFLFPILAVTTALCFATRAVSYLVFAVWITLTVIVLLNLVYSGGPSLAIARVIDTVLGGALAFGAALALAISGALGRPPFGPKAARPQIHASPSR